ncbi:MAG: protein jag [Negativicutes bacterium]|nr:protein jag [Negativicutes bacterium]
MTPLEKTGKTVEDAVNSALAELGVSLERVEVEVLEEPSKGLFGFLGSKPARVRVTLKPEAPKMTEAVKQTVKTAGAKPAAGTDAVQVAKNLLTDIFRTMKLKVMIEKMTQEDHVVLNLRGNDLGVLIGKHGQTLDALQYLVNLAANKDADTRVRIVLDVENYRKRRAATLTQLAERLADRVKRRGERVVLEPMSPHERKIIHMALQQDPRISTYSEGEEPFRKVVIALKK